jgi:hypothetical protein
MAANGISNLSTKEEKQVAKLTLASLKRQGFTLDLAGNVISGPDITKVFYRVRNQYDITELPTQYNDNNIVDNPNVSGLVQGRPWITPVVVLAGAIIMETGDDLLLENGNQIYTEV